VRFLYVDVWSKILLIPLGVAFTAWPLVWTIMRILRPVDLAAKERNLPFRFSMGDFLCLFWVVQLPLAFVYQIQGRETEPFYWVLMAAVWAVAPLVWVTCARALSKAGVSAGKHRFIFLGIVVPTVYYGLFPFIGLSWAGIGALALRGMDYFLAQQSEIILWALLMIALIVSGFYSPWMVRHAGAVMPPDEDG
jgi:hypothetical protein